MASIIPINPQLMIWARETAGLSVEEAAAKLGLKSTAKATAEEKLGEVERGQRPISRGILERAAATYRRPLISFYLPSPPARGERGEDFRTTAGASPRDDAVLDALTRSVRARQQLLRDALLDDEDAAPLSFVASARMTMGAESVAAAIRSTLGVDPAQQRAARDADALFSILRAAAERAGIYILLLGDVGSYHSKIGEDVFRGMALADNVAPFIVINDNDAKAARSFTLLHELSHLWLGESGVSGPLRGLSANRIERFCNEVAGEFLLPRAAVRIPPSGQSADIETALSLTADIARTWNVSQGVVTTRLLQDGSITEDVAGALFQAFAARWRADRQRIRESRDPEEGGPTYYQLRRSQAGAGLLDAVRRALRNDVLTHTKAAKILGVPATAIDPLLREVRRTA